MTQACVAWRDRLGRLWADYGTPIKLTLGTRLALFWVGMVLHRERIPGISDRAPDDQLINGWLNWDNAHGGWIA